MPNTNMSNKSMLLVLLILGQLIIVIAITSYNFVLSYGYKVNFHNKDIISFFLFVLSLIITILTLVIFNEIIKLSKQQF